MSLIDILNPYKLLCEEENLLEAKRFVNNFSFGFELEGYCTLEKDADWSLPGYHRMTGEENGDMPEGNVKVLYDRINELLGVSGYDDGSTIERDGSVTYPDDDKGGWGFEYGSPIMKCTVENMGRLLKMLLALKDEHVYTNDSCGFHIHISFPELDQNNAIWLLFNMANDKSLREKIVKLTYAVEGSDYDKPTRDNTESISFLQSTYAKESLLKELTVKNGKLPNVTITNEKYLVVKVHEHGTLEWRGPRGFLHGTNKINAIRAFLKQFWSVLLAFNEALDRNECAGFTREEVYNNVTFRATFDTAMAKALKEKTEKMIERVKKDPSILIKLKPSDLDNLCTYNENFSRIISDIEFRIGTEYGEKLSKCWDKIPMNNKKYIFRAMRREREWATLLSLARHGHTFKDDELNVLIKVASDEMSDVLRLLSDIPGSMSVNSSSLMLQFMSSVGSINKSIFNILASKQDGWDWKVYQWILDNSYNNILRHLPNISKKNQYRIVRKNPYNIQYINNPDKEVVQSLISKYGDEIKNFIMEVF